MSSLSRDQVMRHLGDIDDLTMSRIIATGATERELQEAIHEVARSDELGERTPVSRCRAVSRLRVILRELLEEEREAYESAYD